MVKLCRPVKPSAEKNKRGITDLYLSQWGHSRQESDIFGKKTTFLARKQQKVGRGYFFFSYPCLHILAQPSHFFNGTTIFTL